MSTAWLEAYLKKFAGTLVVVTHDRYFLSNVTEWILELENSRAIPYKGNYQAYHAERRKLLGDEADRPHRMTFRPIRPT